MPKSEQLGTTVSLVILGLALSMLANLPSRAFAFVVLGSELTLSLSGTTQLAVVLVGLVCTGMDTIARSHPATQGRTLGYTMTFWVLPSLVVLAGLVLLGRFTWWGYRVMTIALTGAVLSGVIIVEYRSSANVHRVLRPARLALNALVYVSALVLFTTLYGERLRSVLSASAIAVVSHMLALDLFRDARTRTSRIWLYAGLIGLAMGQLTWALNYCGVSARLGGTCQLLVFYVLAGVVQQHLGGRLTRRAVAEYAVLFVAGLAVLVWLLA